MRYISVSGIESASQIAALEQHNATIAGPRSPEFLVGIQASEKSQFDKIENSRGHNWHPVGDEIWRLLKPLRKATRRIIHYSFDATKNPGDVRCLIDDLLERKPENVELDGIQFNNLRLADQDYEDTLALIEHGSYKIAQLSAGVLRRCRPEELARRLADSSFSHVLVDTSGGMGRQFDLNEYIRTIEAFMDNAPDLEIGVAGGFGPGSMGYFEVLLSRYPELSCDAEGNLRIYPDNMRQEHARSSFSVDRAKTYITEAHQLIQEYLPAAPASSAESAGA